MKSLSVFKLLVMPSVLLISMMQISFAVEGLVVTKSTQDVLTTAEKLKSILVSKGMTVFGQVDHRAGAEKAGLSLRPTQILIFGNPTVGTPLMNCSQSIAIDLPQKILIWEDENGDVWLGYNDPEYLKTRHATQDCDDVFGKVAGALANFTAAAAAP